MKVHKVLLLIVVLIVMVLSFAVQTNAALNFRGEGTSAHGTYMLIYDDESNITWYDYTHTEANHASQTSWAAGLTVTLNGQTFDEWRLPLGPQALISPPQFPTFGYDGYTTEGYNVGEFIDSPVTRSEFGKLFYDDLGNNGRQDINGTWASVYGLTSSTTGYYFDNLIEDDYWAATGHPGCDHCTTRYEFGFPSGGDILYNPTKINLGIAVMSGDVAPEPVSSTLFIIGGATLAFRRFWKKKRTN